MVIRQGDRLTIEARPVGALVRPVHRGEAHCTARARKVAESRCVRCREYIGIGRVYVEVRGVLHPAGRYHRECAEV